MKLYGYYRSSASYRIRIVLNFKGLDWEYVPVALNRGQQREAAFTVINPAGRVPVLDCGPDLLSQSPAIAEFLEEKHPFPPLMPSDPGERAQVREMQHLVGCDIHPLQNLRVLQYLRSEYGQDDEGVGAWCRKWIGEGLAAYETLAAKRSSMGRFSVGDVMTLADAWLIPQVYNARRFGVDLEPFPTIGLIVDHCAELEPVAAAHPSRQQDAPG